MVGSWSPVVGSCKVELFVKDMGWRKWQVVSLFRLETDKESRLEVRQTQICFPALAFAGCVALG